MTMKKQTKGWLDDKADDAEFLRHLAHEDFIEDFLSYVEDEMTRTNVSRADLARRMKCQPSNVTQLFQRTRNLTSATMVDIAFHLKLRLRLLYERFSAEREIRAVWQRSTQPSPTLHISEVPSAEESAVRPPVGTGSCLRPLETERLHTMIPLDCLT